MNNLHVFIGADHEGFALKQHLLIQLSKLGWQIDDMGTSSSEPVDYPIIAEKVCTQVAKNVNQNRGILICATGIGMCMVANRIPGILAGQVWNSEMAARSRIDDDLNVLCLAAAYIAPDTALGIATRWLETDFSHAERHERRISEVKELD